MSKNTKTGWTSNNSTAGWGTDKAPPPPPEPGLYRFEVASADTKQVGADNKPGINMKLMLGEPVAGGDPVNTPVFATHACTQERWYVFLQLASACNVEIPDSDGSEALKEFCTRLLDSKGGICRIKHGKDLSGNPRAEVAFGNSYLTEEEAAAELSGVDPKEAAEGANGTSGRRKSGRKVAGTETAST